MTPRRIAALIVVAALVMVASASTADTLTLTLVSQNNTSITLGWTPQTGYGYLFSADGNLVSRTNDASRSTVKFSKSFSTYEVAVIVKGAIGTYPTAPPPPPSPQCSDGLDNDGDSKIDYPADPGCTSLTDTSEVDPPPPAAQCADGIDNDQDGKIDLSDPGCSSATDNDETDPPPPTGANRYLSPNGNDANACTQAAPCRSMQRGFAVAAAGDVVSMAAGSYPAQYLINANRSVTFRAAGAVVIANELWFECTTGITVDGGVSGGIKARDLRVARGNRNLVVRFTEHGGGTYTTNNEDDPVVVGNVSRNGTNCSTGNMSDGVVLDGMRVHDYFWHQNPGNAHPDCMQFYGGSNNVTIRNSLFERCAESFIGSFPDFGDVKNTLIEDTTFRDISEIGKGTYFAAQFGCNTENNSFQGIGDGFTIRRTTWTPNALGIEGVGISLRSDCQHFLVENNTFQYGPGQWACDYWADSWNDTVVWRNNTFLDGNGCIVP